jgi:Holliday junction resolvase RusA-like endonuclease
MKHTLVIQGKLPNLNDYTKACRTNKFAGAEMKRKVERLISQYIAVTLKNTSLKGKVRLEFRWYEENKRRDLDNICFAKKFILDALVGNKVIETDDWRGVEGFTDTFFIDKANPRVEVDIEDVK